PAVRRRAWRRTSRRPWRRRSHRTSLRRRARHRNGFRRNQRAPPERALQRFPPASASMLLALAGEPMAEIDRRARQIGDRSEQSRWQRREQPLEIERSFEPGPELVEHLPEQGVLATELVETFPECVRFRTARVAEQ